MPPIQKLLCSSKSCSYYGSCRQKRNPFKGNLICRGYEKYVNQDSISDLVRHKIVPFTDANIEVQTISAEDSTAFDYANVDKREIIIRMFFFNNEPPKVISEEAHCSVQYVYSIINECKRKLLSTLINKKKGNNKR